MKNITQSKLKEILHYDPETGLFTWLYSRGCSKAGSIAGTIDNTGYVRIAGARAHRLAWLYMTGEWPKEEIDHNDLDKSNNCWKNIREATHQQNKFNRKPTIKNKLGIKGVHFRKSENVFRAQIQINKKVKHLGDFKTVEEASKAYQIAAKELFGNFAW